MRLVAALTIISLLCSEAAADQSAATKTSSKSSVTTKISTPSSTSTSKLKTTSCEMYTTTTAKFGSYTPGATPTNGFADVDWNSWTVVNASDYGLKATSGSNVIIAPSFFGSTLTNDNGGLEGGLKRFTFGCVWEIYGGGYRPQDCTITVAAPGVDSNYPVEGGGPYSFTWNETALLMDGTLQPLQAVTLPSGGDPGVGIVGSELIFNVLTTDNSASGLIVFDDLVFVRLNPACP